MFKDKDVVCFLGDSLTADGRYMAEIYQYLRKKYKIKCYNCGIPGGTARMLSLHMHSTCLIYNPDHVAVTVGINDLAIAKYSAENMKNAEIAEQRRKTVEIHKEKYEQIICDIIASGAQPIVCLTAPFDDVNPKARECFACRPALEEIIENMRRLAKKYGCPIVDYYGEMYPLLDKMDIISPDRVHPTALGYHVMAQIFLRDTGEKDACEYDTPFEFEEWNKARFDAEQKLRKMNFAEYCGMLDRCWMNDLPMEEKKKIALERYEASPDKTAFVPLAYKDYSENADKMDRLRGEVIKLTVY